MNKEEPKTAVTAIFVSTASIMRKLLRICEIIDIRVLLFVYQQYNSPQLLSDNCVIIVYLFIWLYIYFFGAFFFK